MRVQRFIPILRGWGGGGEKRIVSTSGASFPFSTQESILSKKKFFFFDQYTVTRGHISICSSLLSR